MARSKKPSGAGAAAWGPTRHLKHIESHRFPLFLATWEATHSDLTPKTVSQLTGGRISYGALYYWLRGDFLPTLESAEVLAQGLGRLDLVSWLGEGALYLESLHHAARQLEPGTERHDAHRRMLAKIRGEDADDVMARWESRLRSGGVALEPVAYLKRLEKHRYPLLRAAWDATRSHRTWEEVIPLTRGKISATAFGNWITGQAVPTLDAAEVLAKALGRPDLLSWLREGVLWLEWLRQAARNVERATQRRRACSRMAEKIQEQDAGDAIVEHFQGLSRGQRQALLRRLEKPALERP